MTRIICWVFLLLIMGACSNDNASKADWPDKLVELEVGLKVRHSTDTVYATLNRKDPETRGKYQLKFTTTVSAMNEELEMIEFGGYFWENEQWILRSIYDRPFNQEEFDKWYGAEGGKLPVGKKFSDTDNWLTKSDHLSGETKTVFLYFIAKNKEGKRFVGVKEIVGVLKMR